MRLSLIHISLVDVNEAVPKGTLGGFVEYEQNLSQEGSCWIYDQAICCERAVVERSAGLFQEAIAKGDALSLIHISRTLQKSS